MRTQKLARVHVGGGAQAAEAAHGPDSPGCYERQVRREA